MDLPDSGPGTLGDFQIYVQHVSIPQLFRFDAGINKSFVKI
jgi:hypothetical protein